MFKVTKIMTDDGKMFDDFKKAKKYLEVEYGDKLCRMAHKLLSIEKYTPMCEFLDANLEEFKELIRLRKESNQLETDICEDED